MTEIILISDGEDDIRSIPGPSRLRAPIFIDDSDDDDEPIQSLQDLMAIFVNDRKGKRKANTSVPPPRVSPSWENDSMSILY